MISYIIPTRDRPEMLRRTVEQIGALGDHAEAGGAEIIVADNASSCRLDLPRAVGPVRVTLLRLDTNIAAAARNLAARRACGEWLVMLDDDSAPVDTGWLAGLAAAPSDTAALAGDIMLPDGTRERGGLPEVFVGCGAAIRREVFLALGGYDATFEYYAEEYDLCARIIASGGRVAFEPSLRVLHHKAQAGRSFGRILARLVRNNAWVIARYAPQAELARAMAVMLDRYEAIASREGVGTWYTQARRDLESTLPMQPRRPLSAQGWARCTGQAAAVQSLRRLQGRRACLIEPGKHEHIVRAAALDQGLCLVGEGEPHGARLIGTLSPGPMFDAMARHGTDRSVVAPWVAAERFRPRPRGRASASAA